MEKPIFTDIMKCPKCGFENNDNSKFCINCSNNLFASQEKICSKCGSKNVIQAKFCNNCASNLNVDFSFNSNKNEREEALRKEIEKIKIKNSIYNNRKKNNKKWIALSILLILIITLPSAYFIWFRSFQTQTQKSVQTIDNSYVYSNSNQNDEYTQSTEKYTHYMKSGFKEIDDGYKNYILYFGTLEANQDTSIDNMIYGFNQIVNSFNYAKSQFQLAYNYGNIEQKNEASAAIANLDKATFKYKAASDMYSVFRNKGYTSWKQLPTDYSTIPEAYYYAKKSEEIDSCFYSKELNKIALTYGYDIYDYYCSFQTQTQKSIQ